MSKNRASNICCFNCNQRHHLIVCENKAPNFMHLNQDQAATSFSSPNHVYSTINQSTSQRDTVHEETTGDVGQCTTTMFVDTKKAILLQMAKGYISKAQIPGVKVIARLIFDSGSQRSYVSERLRDDLGLPSVSKETLTINGFGSDTGMLLNSV